MKLPRDISGRELVKSLSKLGYEIRRQTGSHLRLTTQQNGTHHVTVPNQDALKPKTLNIILSMVSNHFKMTKQELLEILGL